MAESQPALLEPGFLRRLEQLELTTKKIFHGHSKGDRLSKRRGQSMEFADFRNYVVGDDLRFLDWNLYARLDKLFLRIFLEEEDLHFYLLIDNSLSMGFGEPTKLRYATQVAAALGFIALTNSDRVIPHVFNDKLSERLPPLRGRHSVNRLLTFLQNVEPAGTSNLNESLRTFSLQCSVPGVVVVLSDFMDKGGYEDALRYLLARRMDVYVVQILSHEELEPDIDGDLQMIDVEDENATEITVSPALLYRYRQNLKAFCEEIQQFCSRRGMTYLFASNQEPFEQLVLNAFRRRGLVR